MTVTLVLLAAAAVAGCGGNDDDPAAPASSAPGRTEGRAGTTSTTGPPCDPADPSPAADGVVLSFDPPVVRSGEPVRWALRVRNGGAEPVDLVFSSGQSGDVVLSRDGEPVYRWSAGRSFTQAVRCETIGVGHQATYELEDEAVDVPPGRYDYEVSLASQPAPPPVTGSLDVAG